MDINKKQIQKLTVCMVALMVLFGLGAFTGKFYQPIAQASPNNPLDLTAQVNGTVYAIEVTATKIYIGGDFTEVGGQVRNNIAALNLDGTLDTFWDPNIPTLEQARTVSSIYATDTAIYVGGNFQAVNNGVTPRSYAAAFEIANGLNIGTALAWDPNSDSTVYKVVGNGSKIYLGGLFTTMGGVERYYLAAVDSITGALDAAWNPKMSSYVYDMLIHNDKLFVVGLFGFANQGQGTEEVRNFGANFNLANGSDVGIVQAWNPNSENVINSIAYYNDQIYLGGVFNQIGAELINYAARVNATDGAVDASWAPGLDGNVFDIVISDEGNIFLGGAFDNIGGVAHKWVGLVNSSDGAVSAWDPVLTIAPLDTVYALDISNSTVQVGGDFNRVNGSATHANFAQFRFPKISFTVTTSSADEDEGTVNIEVNQDIVSDFDTNFAITVDDASTATRSFGRFERDYNFSESAPYAVTTGEQLKNIGIVVNDDSEEEESETVILHLAVSDPVFFGTNTTHTLTISDNDVAAPPTFTVTPISINITEGGSTGSYSIVADQIPTSPPGCGVCVAGFGVNISHDAQVSVDQDTINFTAFNWETPQIVVVTAVNDSVIEGDHASIITHTVEGHEDAVINDITFNIIDNDVASSSGGGGGGCINFCGLLNTGIPLVSPPSLAGQNPMSGGGGSQANSPIINLPENGSHASQELLTLNLRRGQRNSQVKILQRFLNEHGFILASSGYGSPGQETTYFGPRTYNALIRFQRVYIDTLHSVTGKVDKLTRDLINSLF